MSKTTKRPRNKERSRNKEIWYVSMMVDPGINYSHKMFNKKVRSVLKHPKGWEYIDGNVFFEFVPWTKHPNISLNKITIRLSSNNTIEKICGFQKEKLSCCDMETKECWLNYDRWTYGSKASGLPLYKYRNYMINHEVGHALGRLHVECPCEGCSAPIMMQHTITIGECKPNDKPIKGE